MTVVKAAAAVIAAGALYTPFLLKDSANSFDGECDYLIILGYRLKNNSPQSQPIERIEAAAEYLKIHSSALALASGGIMGDNTVAEADVIKKYLVESGIDESRIITETESKTTFQNFENLTEIIRRLSGKDLSDVNVCVVTSDCHAHRALMFAKSAGLKNVNSITVRTKSKRLRSFLREYPLAVDAGLRCAVKKIKRG